MFLNLLPTRSACTGSFQRQQCLYHQWWAASPHSAGLLANRGCGACGPRAVSILLLVFASSAGKNEQQKYVLGGLRPPNLPAESLPAIGSYRCSYIKMFSPLNARSACLSSATSR